MCMRNLPASRRTWLWFLPLIHYGHGLTVQQWHLHPCHRCSLSVLTQLLGMLYWKHHVSKPGNSPGLPAFASPSFTLVSFLWPPRWDAPGSNTHLCYLELPDNDWLCVSLLNALCQLKEIMDPLVCALCVFIVLTCALLFSFGNNTSYEHEDYEGHRHSRREA